MTTIRSNVLYGLGEGSNVSNATYQAYALRWKNRAYREIYTKAGYKFKYLNKRAVFRTADGQQTYQAPSDFIGFLTIRDESNNNVIDQVTPEEFARDVSTSSITDEAFTSDYDAVVSLDNKAIAQYSETVTTTDGVTTYTRDTDYTMSYSGGSITVLSTGSMSDATSYEIDYLHWSTGKPVQFCFEYDTTNERFVFKFDPVPNDIFITSLVYPHKPSSLSSTVDPTWDLMELAIESGGIYYGSLELIESAQQRLEFKIIYRDTVGDLVKLDQDLVPKHDRIKLVMRHTDYTNRDINYINRGR